jgi:hypothetical protein
MRKNRWLLFGLLVACVVGVVLVVLALLPPRPGVTKQNFDRIEVGMARAEVEAIFGGPANASWPPTWGNKPLENEWEDHVRGDAAIVNFDENDRVASTAWLPGLPDERSAWEKLLDRLPWHEKPPPRPSARKRLPTP